MLERHDDDTRLIDVSPLFPLKTRSLIGPPAAKRADMRNMTTRSWALLAAVSGLLLGSSVGCIVIAAVASDESVEDAVTLSTSQISMQMDHAATTRVGVVGVMTELRTGVMTHCVREDRTALVSGSDD